MDSICCYGTRRCTSIIKLRAYADVDDECDDDAYNDDYEIVIIVYDDDDNDDFESNNAIDDNNLNYNEAYVCQF